MNINFAVHHMITIMITIDIYISICSLSLQIPWFVSFGLLEAVGLSWLRDGAKGNAVLWGAESKMLSTASNVSNFKKIQI